MNYWIFQSVVEQYDLRSELREGQEESWLVSRYRQQMAPGELVFFWLAGAPDIRGIYGWGTLLAIPEAGNDDQYEVKVRVDKRLSSHVPIKKIRAVRKLKELSILRFPQGTNFILSREEAEALAGLIDSSETPQPQIPPVPLELLEAIETSECVLFAGAGLSARSGVLTWNQFLANLLSYATEQNVVDPKQGISLKAALEEGARNEVADELVHAFGPSRNMLQQFLQGSFPETSTLSLAHQRLGKIAFAGVITPNYDTLLEKAFPNLAQAGVYTPKDAETLLDAHSQKRPFILKLYGTLQRPDTLILAPVEYEETLSANVTFAKFVEGLFFSRSFFFIGLSLEGIEEFLSGFSFRGAVPRKHFALVAVSGTAWKTKADFLGRRFNVQVIDFAASESFLEFDAFVWALSERTLPKPSVPSSAEAKTVPMPGIRKVILENIGPFEKLELEFAANKWKVLLGDNGVGKSTVLRAIAVGIVGSDARSYAARLVRAGQTQGRITLITERNPHGYVTEIKRKDMESEADVISRGSRCLEAEGWPALGFSPFRMVTWAPSGGPQQIVQKGRPTVDDLLPLLSGEADPRMDRLKQWIVNLDAADSPRQLSTLQGHQSRVASVAFAPDGRTLVSGSIDKTVRIWDSWNGNQTLKIDAHPSGVNAVAVTADGQTIVSGSFDRTAKSWGFDGHFRKKFGEHQTQVLSVGVSPNGKLLVSGTEHGSVRIWDLASGTLRKQLPAEDGSAWSVAVCADNKTVVAGFQNGNIKKYDIESGNLLATFIAGAPVWSIAVSADGATLVAGTESGAVTTWDLASHRELRKFVSGGRGILSVAISTNGQIVASGGEDGRVRAWDADSEREIVSVQAHASAVWSVALTGDGHQLASGSDDASIKIWNVPVPNTGLQQFTTIKQLFDVIAAITKRSDIQYLRVTENYRVLVKTADAPDGIPLEMLSQGTTSLFGWVGALCQRLKETSSDPDKKLIPTDSYALVLVDELDAHMHPQWQQTLVPRLKEVFPNVQFIASSHSPLIAEGLEAAEIDRFVLSAGKVSVVDVSPDMTVGRADQILTSPLFGLTSSRGERTRAMLDRYAELAALERELSTDEDEEFERLSNLLGIAVPTDEQDEIATKVFDLIQDAVEKKLEAMGDEERAKTLRELKVQSKEIATGSTRQA